MGILRTRSWVSKPQTRALATRTKLADVRASWRHRSSGNQLGSSVTTSGALSRTRLAIQLNGSAAETAAATLAELLAEQGFTGARVATAVNGDFVAERARGATRLAEGDSVEIVSARQGG